MQISATITKQKTDQPVVNGHLKVILWHFVYILLIYLCNLFLCYWFVKWPETTNVSKCLLWLYIFNRSTGHTIYLTLCLIDFTSLVNHYSHNKKANSYYCISFHRKTVCKISHDRCTSYTLNPMSLYTLHECTGKSC